MPTTDRRILYRVVNTPYGAVGVIRRTGKMRGLTRVAFALLWLFIFTIPWENVIIIPGLGTIGRLVGIVAFGVGILAIIDRGHLRRFAALHGLMALFVIWGAFTLIWSKAPDRTRDEVVTYLQVLLMVWIIREMATNDWTQKSLISAFVLGTYVSTISTLMSAITGISAHYHRYSAEGFNPGDLALTVVLSIPFSFYLASTEKNRFWLWIYRIQPAVAACAIFCTAARGALIDLGLAFLIVPLSFRRWNIGQQVTLVLVGVVAAIGIVLVVPATSWTRFAGIGAEVSTGTLNQRTTVWKAGFDVFREHPVNGIGVNAFAPTIQRSLGTPRQIRHAAANDVVELVAHNSFISVLVEEGVVGFLLFILILASLWKGVFRLNPAERNTWAVVLLVWTVGVMELTWEYRKPTWLLFGLLAAAISSIPSRPSPKAALVQGNRFFNRPLARYPN
jgi:O-antigen ligase